MLPVVAALQRSRRRRQRRHDARRGRPARRRGRRRRRQRRVRRAGRRRDAAHRRRARRPLHRHALARALGVDAAARVVRRRAGRGAPPSSAARADGCAGRGIAAERLALDPGIGFAKNAEHNWRLLRHLDDLHALGHPLVVGSSRKAFLGALLADPDGTPGRRSGAMTRRPPSRCWPPSSGAWCVRVHDVRRSSDAVRVAARFACGGGAGDHRPRRGARRQRGLLCGVRARPTSTRWRTLWADDDGVVCVHPAAPPIRGRAAVMRSWMALMADVAVHPVLPHRRRGDRDGRRSPPVTCTENVLSAGADTPVGVFAGGRRLATNVFRRTPDGWRLWVHHASPVLSSTEPLDGQEEDSP